MEPPQGEPLSRHPILKKLSEKKNNCKNTLETLEEKEGQLAAAFAAATATLDGNEGERQGMECAARENAAALDAEDDTAARRDRSVGKLPAPGPAGGLSGPCSIS
jgi:peptidoglycan hydrolase CwlO-like protein